MQVWSIEKMWVCQTIACFSRHHSDRRFGTCRAAPCGDVVEQCAHADQVRLRR